MPNICIYYIYENQISNQNGIENMWTRSDGKARKIIQGMNRRNAMFATQIITGHNQFQRHLHIMFQDEPPGCPRCNLEPETSEHVIKNCPAYKDIRRQILGEYFLAGQLHEYKLEKIFKFVPVFETLLKFIWRYFIKDSI